MGQKRTDFGPEFTLVVILLTKYNIVDCLMAQIITL